MFLNSNGYMTDFQNMTPRQRQKEKAALGIRLGKRIREARLSKGISQEELAHRANYYRTYVGRIENGAVATSVHTIWRLAKAMKISLSDLLKGL